MQKIDLYGPIENTRIGPPPLVINVKTTRNVDYVAGGVPASASINESYVLFSALPTDLQERVKVAIQSLMSSV